MQLPLRGVDGRWLLRLLRFARASGRNSPGKPGENGKNETHDEPATASKLIVPVGLAVSCLAHLAFLTPAVILGGANPLDTPPADTITVDIVSSADMPKQADQSAPAETTKEAPSLEQPSKQEPASEDPAIAAAEPSPAVAAPGQTTSASEPPPAAPHQLPATPQAPATAQSMLLQTMAPSLPFGELQPGSRPMAEPEAPNDADPFGMPLTMPDGTVGGRPFDPAVEKADVAKGVAAAFRSHLKTCAKRPSEVAPGARVIVRLYLNQDGSLVAGLPENPKTLKVSMGGGELFMNAREALIKCQPYTMLPPDQYAEWKMLDLTFTAENFP